jgi:FAD:protein FMN transferase
MPVLAARTRTAWEWTATGTTWRIHHTGWVDEALAAQVATLVHTDELRWSRFIADSDVSRITAGSGAPVQVETDTLDLLEACVRWTGRTDGVFQPLVGGRLAAWGYDHSLLESPAGTPTSPPADPVTGAIEVDRSGRTARIPAGCTLDLGGIAKSWIARRAAAIVVRSCDDPSVLVDAGGDLVAARGDHVVGVESPGEPHADPLAHVLVEQGQGVATSGYGRRSWRNGDGRLAHHLIDAADGQPGVRSHATVIAEDPVAADVLAKTLALRPDRLGGMTVAAMVMMNDHVRTTPRWDQVMCR